MLHFGCRSTSADVDGESIVSGNPENSDIAFRNACLSVVEHEITTSGLEAAILRFGCSSTSASVDFESIKSGNPENRGITVGIVCLSFVEREIYVVPEV